MEIGGESLDRLLSLPIAHIMKITKLLFVSVAVFVRLTPLFAQNYAINWYSIAGGGGTSSGGVFSISGTIGQPDAGLLTAANYSMVGGFWSILSYGQPPVQPPVLTVSLAGNNTVVVEWPSSTSAAFLLQQSTDLYGQGWAHAPQPVTDNGITKSVTITPAVGNLFFRLFAP